MSKKYTLENISEETVRYFASKHWGSGPPGEIKAACQKVLVEPFPEIRVIGLSNGGYRAWCSVDGKIVDYFTGAPDTAFAAVCEHLKSTGRFR